MSDQKLSPGLYVKPGVVMTPVLMRMHERLNPYFVEAGIVAFITSGLRDANDQLRIIRKYLVQFGLNKKYPEAMTCQLMERRGEHYVWQMAWSHLLNIGVIINPPLSAVCLMDYIRNGKNKKGQLISQTPHTGGNCLDIGGAGGTNATIQDELVVMERAMADKVEGLINILPEHNNNSIHCDCK